MGAYVSGHTLGIPTDEMRSAEYSGKTRCLTHAERVRIDSGTTRGCFAFGKTVDWWTSGRKQARRARKSGGSVGGVTLGSGTNNSGSAVINNFATASL